MNAPECTTPPQTPENREWSHWNASLTLHYDRNGPAERTRPTRREHTGPLRILKGFPSPLKQADLWEQIIVHPPGGIATGDRLDIRLALSEHARVLITSPGAAKWYRARAQKEDEPTGAPIDARQSIVARVGEHASLEWLPLESIVFNQANAYLSTRVELASQATLLSADLVCLGRPAANDPFTRGRLRLDTRITRQTRPIFVELADIDPTDPSDSGERTLRSAAALYGASCFGTLLAVPASKEMIDQKQVLESLRNLPVAAQAMQENELAITALPDLIVARWRGHSAQQGWRVLRPLWHYLRKALLGHPIQQPRIWQC